MVLSLRMKRAPAIAVLAAALYFLLSFNAYACLVPLYGGMEVAPGSDCTMPQEQPARQHCDAFKSLSVQTTPQALQAVDLSTHAVVAVEPLAVQSFLSPPHLSARLWGASLPIDDVLALTAVLRL